MSSTAGTSGTSICTDTCTVESFVIWGDYTTIHAYIKVQQVSRGSSVCTHTCRWTGTMRVCVWRRPPHDPPSEDSSGSPCM